MGAGETVATYYEASDRRFDHTDEAKKRITSWCCCWCNAALTTWGGWVGRLGCFFFRHYTPAAQGPVLFHVGVSIRHSSLARNIKIIRNYLKHERTHAKTRKTLSDAQTEVLIFLSIPSCTQLSLSRDGPIISAGSKTTTRKQAKRGDAVPAIHTAAM